MTAAKLPPAAEPTTAQPMTADQAAAYQRLRSHLAYLKLPTAAECLPTVLDAARTEGLSVTAALERLLQAEVDATENRRQTGRLRFACLPAPWTLDRLDYDASPGLDRALITDLASLRFLGQATNVLLIGPPGVGKTHIAVGLAQGRGSGLAHLFHDRRGSRGPVSPRGDRGTVGHHHAVLRWPDSARDR